MIVHVLLLICVCCSSTKGDEDRQTDHANLQVLVDRVALIENTLHQQIQVLQKENSQMRQQCQDLSNHALEQSQRLTALEKISALAPSVVTNPVGFTAVLWLDTYYDTMFQTIIFDELTLNAGNAFDPSTGVFTAPVAGIYLFSVNIRSVEGYGAEARLTKNDFMIGNVYSGRETSTEPNNGITGYCHIVLIGKMLPNINVPSMGDDTLTRQKNDYAYHIMDIIDYNGATK